MARNPLVMLMELRGTESGSVDTSRLPDSACLGRQDKSLLLARAGIFAQHVLLEF